MNSESKITLSATERNILTELYEDGMDYIVCEECAKKAKLNWNKLETLTPKP